MTKSRHILPPRHPWSEVEIMLLRQCYADYTAQALAAALGHSISSVYQKASALGLCKSETFFASDRSGRVQRGKQDPRLRATQFRKGQTPWNAGTKGLVGVQEGCRATQFKKGRPAHESRNYRPIGSLRVNPDGYLERKVSDDAAIAPARRWVGVHRLVWEAAHGPVPAGHAVVFLPGRHSVEPEAITLDALELVTRQELMRRNSYHQYGPDVARAVQLRGAISRAINKRAKEAA
jgi:hypothetical protein